MNQRPTLNHPLSFGELSPAAEKILREFESAWVQEKCPEIESFVNERDLALLEELVRVDMEFRSERGLPFSVPKYLERFPFLKESTGALERIESEAKRLRIQPRSRKPVSSPLFPAVPQTFLGFELIGVLGEGAFGKVYLARQGDLARRLVVLKITNTQTSEGQRLAQLQHTNIVPIYSQHEQSGLHAICMPFLGIATLADLIPASHGTGLEPDVSPRELVSTLTRRKSRTLPGLNGAPAELDRSSRETPSGTEAAEIPPIADQSVETDPDRGKRYEAFGDRNREETLAWLWNQIASGLSFAHSQGIIHGDIKPANILISDRGYPMLLDFNLAINRRDQLPNLVGGTLPYLSPEQIRAIASGSAVDERDDLYSLGVVFYQLLTGRLPFPDRGHSFETASEAMLQDRLRGATSITKLVPQLNANLGAMVDKSLDPVRENRYQSATELQEDLQCFLNLQPLRHATNPSLALRARNWIRRHPRLTSASSVAVVATILLAGIGWLTLNSWQRNSRLQAAGNTREWLDNLKVLRHQLTSVDPPPLTLAARVGELERRIQQPPAGMTAVEIAEDQAALLTSDQTQAAREELVASHLGLAGALLRRSTMEQGAAQEGLIRQVRQHHEWVLKHSPQHSESAGFLLQQSRLAAVMGESDKAAQLRERAGQQGVTNPLDRNLLAYEWMTLGDYDRAAELLEQSVALDGLDLEAWLLLGNTRAQQKRLSEAEACFSVCLSLDPDSETAVFNRARVRTDLQNGAGAVLDYDRAIKLNPEEPAYFANRGLLAMARQDWPKALEDFSQALKQSSGESRLLYLRYQVYTAMGNPTAARADFQAFLNSKPSDETGWVLRGVTHLQQGNRQQALLDFDEALKSNPKSSMAWQNKATIFATNPDDLSQAIEAMSKVVELDPHNPTQLATRGVLLARAGMRAEAHRDAIAALRIDPSADTRYRAAGIYALTSRSDPSDRQRAIALIAMAALEQPKLVLGYLESDPDIEPLKADPQWLELVQALKSIQQQANSDSQN